MSIEPSIDHIGPMANDVKGVALLLEVSDCINSNDFKFRSTLLRWPTILVNIWKVSFMYCFVFVQAIAGPHPLDFRQPCNITVPKYSQLVRYPNFNDATILNVKISEMPIMNVPIIMP